MFEFHGWAVIRVPENDDETSSQHSERATCAIKDVRSKLNEIHDEFSTFDVERTSNGLIVVFAHGLRNHRFEPVIDLFLWIAEKLPDSYGVLHVLDDEGFKRGADFTNEFRVWRLALGELMEVADPFLSPFIPTAERPCDGWKGELA